MRRVLPISLTILILATFPILTVVYAQDGIASRSAKLDEVRANRAVRANERKVVIDAKRLELKTTQEARRASFQAKLAEMKDQQKATILENLNNRYPNINERWTTHFSQVLDRLEEVLAKIATHSADTAAASKAITSARIAVDNQSLQSYVITITDESNLRSAAQVSNQQLRSDLGVAREAVKSAREAVQAARALIKQAPIQPSASESAVDDIIK
ncbi:hypothetical protein CO050_05460 [Candidatus Roizmanbacteria bacterium CG_4_9_14_0_2_um_filter_38_17]|nr:MAG: hypothetical protein CO050_05460 [Candidatus Roizmanbacteria bacterium CG_4_9_14_0_2_um_filter_38_17]